MWKRCAGYLDPLRNLTSTTAKWEWNETHQKAFEQAKRILSKEVLLTHCNFNKPFEINTDALDMQLGEVISQENIPIPLYSHKLNESQRNYATMEREVLAIVKMLKEYCNALST